MNFLLDTHVFLWMLAEPGRLSSDAAHAIRTPRHSVFVSAVTAVEIAIKKQLGKLEAPDTLGSELASRGLTELPLSFAHGERMAALPLHHGDPFDRMLIAQAQIEQLTLITHDRKIEPYDVQVLWT
jgi:PIN domain nuclease of toxin-antitoxin system